MKLQFGRSSGTYRHCRIKGSQRMANMTRFLCLPVVDRVKRTLPVIGLAFVLGSMTTPAGSSPLPPQTIYVQLVSKGTPDFSISFPRHLFEITTSPCLKSPLQMDLLYRGYRPLSPSATEVSNIMGPGSTSCVHLITSTMPTTAYSLPSALGTHASLECSRLLPPHQSQKN